MAGNLSEWTMEGYGAGIRVLRGGAYTLDGKNYPVINRSAVYNGKTSMISMCFRTALYIKNI